MLQLLQLVYFVMTFARNFGTIYSDIHYDIFPTFVSSRNMNFIPTFVHGLSNIF